jgi:hypothetical protein
MELYVNETRPTYKGSGVVSTFSAAETHEPCKWETNDKNGDIPHRESSNVAMAATIVPRLVPGTVSRSSRTANQSLSRRRISTGTFSSPLAIRLRVFRPSAGTPVDESLWMSSRPSIPIPFRKCESAHDLQNDVFVRELLRTDCMSETSLDLV